MVGFDAAVRELNSAGREIGSAAEGRLGFRCLSGDIVGAKMIPRLPGTTLHRELPGDPGVPCRAAGEVAEAACRRRPRNRKSVASNEAW